MVNSSSVVVGFSIKLVIVGVSTIVAAEFLVGSSFDFFAACQALSHDELI